MMGARDLSKYSDEDLARIAGNARRFMIAECQRTQVRKCASCGNSRELPAANPDTLFNLMTVDVECISELARRGNVCSKCGGAGAVGELSFRCGQCDGSGLRYRKGALAPSPIVRRGSE